MVAWLIVKETAVANSPKKPAATPPADLIGKPLTPSADLVGKPLTPSADLDAGPRKTRGGKVGGKPRGRPRKNPA